MFRRTNGVLHIVLWLALIVWVNVGAWRAWRGDMVAHAIMGMCVALALAVLLIFFVVARKESKRNSGKDSN